MHRWLEHTSEVELWIEGESAQAVFAEAAQALGELLESEPGADAERRQVSVSAGDLPALLAEWLSELVYLAETDGFVPARVVRIDLEQDGVDAEVAGRCGASQSLVKGVTYHRLEMAPADESWRARVVLDV